MSNGLRGQVVLVTGAGRGLGRAFAVALAGADATVAACARTESEVADTARLITDAGGRAAAFHTDVTDPASVQHTVEQVAAALGPIDGLVNNAGVRDPLGPVASTDADGWWRCLEVNLRGAMLCMQAVLPGMLERGRGRIINIASAVGTVAAPNVSAYVTSKCALIRLSEIAAMETRDRGVSIFAIEPGTVRTAMTQELLDLPEGRKWVPWFGRVFAEGRDTTPARAADLVVRIASGEADALSGRFISRADDLDSLIARAAAITADDALTLRLRAVV